MPWKLSDDEPTVVLKVKVPLSMKQFLEALPGGPSKYIRRVIRLRMTKESRKSGVEDAGEPLEE